MNNASLFAILIGGLLVNNFVLSQFLGICPFLGVSKKLNSAVGMSLAVIFVMLMATAATWPIYRLLLEPNDLAYLQTIVFILIIAALVQLVEIVLKAVCSAAAQGFGHLSAADHHQLRGARRDHPEYRQRLHLRAVAG